MATRRFRYTAALPVDATSVFQWLKQPGALERLTPAWQNLEILDRKGGIQDGATVNLRIGMGPFSRKWMIEHGDYIEGQQFRDVLLEGPFPLWQHTHQVTPTGPHTCCLTDEIDYQMPLGLLGQWIGGRWLRKELQNSFAFRHQMIKQDLIRHDFFRTHGAKRILVSGSTGLIGSELVRFLSTGGHKVSALIRSAQTKTLHGISRVQWDPKTGETSQDSLSGFDAILHLAGENIAGRWTKSKKNAIRQSRLQGTANLVKATLKLPKLPATFITASAIGYYGNSPGQTLDENSPAGQGFLADLCREWEETVAPLRERGVRVIQLRIGVVLSPKGGALQKMLLPFQLGMGGKIGSGKQVWSWIALDDVLYAIHHCLFTPSIHGAVNLTSPQSCSNEEFTQVLGHVLNRPTLLPMPAPIARIALGEMANELLLASLNIKPSQLLSHGYCFQYTELESALVHMLGSMKQHGECSDTLIKAA